MPFPSEASVINHNGHDYWRTWFFDECESSGLFGITEKHLPLLKAHVTQGGYRLGTEIFLEDAPYFKGSGTHHLVCGPYKICKSNLSDGTSSVHGIDGNVIVYKENKPENGPWFDCSRRTRTIKDIKVSFPQLASEFNFFPYRFKIEKSKTYKQQLVKHQERECWLCKHIRHRRHY